MSALLLPPPDPDAPCCMAAIHRPDDCTCWRPMLVPHPTAVLQRGAFYSARESRCGDCAYRRDSRERRELEGDRLPHNPDHPFFCHDGMPRVWAYVHPSGAVRLMPRDPETDDYQPVFLDGVAWQADGSPGLLCAGWAADQRTYQRAVTGQQ